MSPVSFPESVYANLPAKSKRELAEATGKRSAASSANQLYKLLGNPNIVRQMPKDDFKGRVAKSGKIKFWTRLGLAIRHFYLALFSNFEKLGKTFAALIPKKGEPAKKPVQTKKTTQKSPSKPSSQKTSPGPKPATPAVSTTRQGGWRQDLMANIGISAAGNVIGNSIGSLFSHRNDDKKQSDALESGEKTHKHKGDEADSVTGKDERDAANEQSDTDASGKHAESSSEQTHDAKHHNTKDADSKDSAKDSESKDAENDNADRAEDTDTDASHHSKEAGHDKHEQEVDEEEQTHHSEDDTDHDLADDQDFGGSDFGGDDDMDWDW